MLRQLSGILTVLLTFLWTVGTPAAVQAQAQGDIKDLTDSASFHRRYDGGDAGDNLGFSMARGDINGDGIPDLIVGAAGDDNNGRSQSGSVYVIYGAAGSSTGNTFDLANATNFNLRFDGAEGREQFGWSVASGDVNNDGFDDVMAGSERANNNGRSASGSVYVIYGAAGSSTGNTFDLANSTSFNLRFDGAAAEAGADRHAGFQRLAYRVTFAGRQCAHPLLTRDRR